MGSRFCKGSPKETVAILGTNGFEEPPYVQILFHI